MSPGDDTDIRTVRAIYDAFARRDVEAALEHVAETVKFTPRATAERIGRDHAYYGHQGVRQYFADAARAWDDLRLLAERIEQVGGEVVVHGRVEAVVEGEPFERAVVWVWQVRDGRAIAMRVSDVD